VSARFQSLVSKGKQEAVKAYKQVPFANNTQLNFNTQQLVSDLQPDAEKGRLELHAPITHWKDFANEAVLQVDGIAYWQAACGLESHGTNFGTMQARTC
jgi:hypothetical protein